MCLLYLDDSGSAGNAAEDYFVLGGVSVFERQCYWLSQRLDELAATIAPDSPGAVEFHASEVFSGRSAPWKGLKDRTERRNMIARVLSVLAHAPGSTSAFACTVHKASFPNADPVEIAFEEICSRFDLQLSRFHSQGDTHRGIIILDRSADETSLRRLASSFRASGTKWGTLRNIAETPLFLES
ncbi:MAG TPA: DUF3800 domain-containing protein, partial [Phycisphaerales bacterium]|nr:DUF3800 domain-containing protein [Phycisphaerales bacterium]